MSVLRLLNRQYPEDWRTAEVMEEYVTLRVDKGVDDERALLEHMNRRFNDGSLPGIAHPSDALRRLPYGPVHVAMLESDPAVAEAQVALSELRAAEAVEDRKAANREQLRRARRRQSCMAEMDKVPNLYREVVELRRIVSVLVDQLDRVSPGSVASLIGDVREPLPQIEE